jgi:predicted AAA+ superfamily ATPase
MKDLKRILSNQKAELDLVDLETLCSRKEEQEIQLNSKLAQIVIGVRRSGKSTLCMKVLMQSGVHFAYVNFDDERLQKVGVEELDVILQELYAIYGSFTHLFLDEVQNVDGWHLFVNRLLRQGIKLVLTGSNANLLSGELSTHLTGRYHQIELYPFSFSEYCTIRGVDAHGMTTKAYGLRDKALDEYLMSGGFPELIASPEISKRDYLFSLREAIVKKDICQRYKIRYKQTLSDLANRLLDWFCQEKSYNDIAKEMSINSVHTVKNYITYLQNAYLLYLLPKFSLKSSERNSARKMYAVDNAFISQHENALLTESFGLRLENVVAVELLRRLHSEYEQLYYLRKVQDFEVDFVVVESSHVRELIQVTYDFVEPSAKLYNREVNGLIKGSHLTRCDNLTLIMMRGEPRDIQVNGKIVHCVLAADWLLQR